MTGYEDRKGPWITTYSGKRFYMFDLREEDFDIEDIAHALSNVCRYNGHSAFHYSVGWHSLLMSYKIYEQFNEPELSLAALLHDASEAYICDVPRPLKPVIPTYKEIESSVEKVIFSRYGLPYPFDPRVKEADNKMLATEKDILFNYDTSDWEFQFEPYDDKWLKMRIATPAKPVKVKELFLRQFWVLNQEIEQSYKKGQVANELLHV